MNKSCLLHCELNCTGGDDMCLYAEHVNASARVSMKRLGETDLDLDHSSEYANVSRTVSTLSPSEGSSISSPTHGGNSNTVSEPSLVSPTYGNKKNKISKLTSEFNLPLRNPNVPLKRRNRKDSMRISFGRMKNYVPIDNKDLNKISGFKKVHDVLSFKSKIKDIKIKNLRDIKMRDLNDLNGPIAQMLGGLVDMLKPNVTVAIEPQQFEVIEKLSRSFEKIGDKLDDIPPSVFEDIGSLTSGLADNLAAGPSMMIKTVCSSIVTMLKSYATDNIREIIFYVSLLSTILYLRSTKATTKKMLLVCSMFMIAGKLVGLASVSAVFSFITSQITSFMFDSEEPIAQMFSMSLLSDIVLGVFALGMFPGVKDISVKKISAYLVDLARIGSSLEAIISVVMRILQYFLDFISEKMGFSSYNILTTAIPNLDKWVDDTREFISAIRSKEKIECPTTYQELRTLEDRSYELLSNLGGSKSSHHVMFIIRNVSNELSRLRVQMEANGVGEKYARRPPLVIMLRGESQIGKSRALRPMILALLRTVMSDEDFKKVEEDFDSQVYSRVPETKFWDGYHGQKVCFFDEFNLTNSKLLSAENASSEIVRAGNVFPYMLHMANLESKGNVYFRSEIIICTSNSATVAAGAQEAVSHPEAVVNRFHFECQVEVRDEFVKKSDMDFPKHERPLDTSKLKSQEFNWNVHNLRVFKRVKKHSGSSQYTYVDSGVYNLPQFVKLAAEKYVELGHLADAISADDTKSISIGESLRNELLGIKPEKKKNPNLFGASSSSMFPRAQASDASPRTFAPSKLNMARYPAPGPSREELEENFRFRADMEQYSFIPYFVNQRLGPRDLQNYLDTYLKWDHDEELLRSLFQRLPAPVVPEHFPAFCTVCSAVKDPAFLVDLAPDTLAEVVTITMPLDSSYARLKERVYENIDSLCAVLKRSGLRMWEKALEVLWQGYTILTDFLRDPMVRSFFLGMAIGFAYYVTAFLAMLAADKVAETVFGKSLIPDAQMQDSAVCDIANKIWTKNYYSIKLGSHAGWGFFSHDNTFVLCNHYIDFWKSQGWGDEFAYLQRGNENEYPIKISTFFDAKPCGDDLSCILLKNFRNHPDLRPLMLNDSYLNNKKTVNIMMVRKVKEEVYRECVKADVVSNVEYSNNARTAKIKVAKSIKYPISTISGDCGLPIFVLDPKTRHQKFVGVHVAGASGYGLSTLFGSNFFFTMQINHESLPRMMVPLYEVAKRPGTSGKSNIVKSELHNSWGPALKSRAKLHPYSEDGTRKIPLHETLTKFDNPIHVYDKELVLRCVSSAVSNYVNQSHYDMNQMRAISDDDAWFGIDGDPYMDGMNRKTSAGYPWNVQSRPGFTGKERFFGKGEALTKDGPDFEAFRKSCKEKEDLLLKGVRPEFIYTLSLKDEVIPHHKAGKPRAFCASNAEYTFLFNKYFKRFNQMMMSGRIHNECAVGINPYSDEWELLMRKLTRFGADSIVAGDFKAYDTNQSAQILEAIGEAILPVFRDREFDGVRRLLWKEVWNSNVIVDGTVVSWLQSLPSGHPATTVINCIFGSVVMRMSFVDIFKDEISLDEFSDYISFIDYGDDNAMGVNDTIKDKFNQITLSEALGRMGLTYTLETKEDTTPLPFRNISDIEFLKRKFRYEPKVGRSVAPLRLSSILEMPYWTKRTDGYDIMCSNICNALQELSLHEEDVFNKWSGTIIEASIERAGYYPPIVDYDFLLRKTLTTELPYIR